MAEHHSEIHFQKGLKRRANEERDELISGGSLAVQSHLEVSGIHTSSLNLRKCTSYLKDFPYHSLLQ
ncbi:hypothetical protein Y1Q_0001595 [Alligator mississippiensis]|uniref:Uncharacterized protein n=1 Tax=Alligator mississippiensis TaxID=8496 RepID=A0A151MA20_ALLMI|nr:hypothetical protein Y1Q_0001595 [Alligator mississippiensis]